jgi:threonine-phosphate decarboxylase
MKPYQHGGDVAAFAAQIGCTPEAVIDLSSNINFVKPDIAIDWGSIEIGAYPDYKQLYRAVAEHYEVEPDAMELFNGGSSAIFSLFAHQKEPSKTATIYSPAYLEYKRAAEVFGYTVEIIDRFTQTQRLPRKGSLVIFVNPSTPDGAVYDMEPLLERWHALGCTVLVDESFIEFTDRASVTHLIERYPRLYVLKSMTKFFGAAGVRAGTLISQAANIAALRHTEPLWKLSALDSAYIQAALGDREFKTHSDTANRESKAYLTAMLERSPLVRTLYPSEANYVLIELAELNAEAFQARLIPERVLVRPCANFDGLSERHVRIAVKSIPMLSRLAVVLRA